MRQALLRDYLYECGISMVQGFLHMASLLLINQDNQGGPSASCLWANPRLILEVSLKVPFPLHLRPQPTTYINVYIQAYMHTFIHTYIHTYIRACIHTCKPTHLHVCTQRVYMYVYICRCVHTYVDAYVLMSSQLS